jgi:hypothetical protein
MLLSNIMAVDFKRHNANAPEDILEYEWNDFRPTSMMKGRVLGRLTPELF